jgi:glutamate/tyrosine decarboxylase-like PLP-dependent enzyme
MTDSTRRAALDISPEDFRALGHALVEHVARHIETLPDRPVTAGGTPSEIRELLGTDSLREHGREPSELLDETARLLFAHSLFNAHPRFWGYITSSPAPLGMLADMLAAAVNPNVGAFVLSPVATEMERQVVRWIAELLGYPSDCGGVMVSGGNMANMVAFLAARRARTPWDVRTVGLRNGTAQLTAYASKETHTWIHKAADLFGLGLDAIRWIETDERLRMRVDQLEHAIAADIAAGHIPFIVIGTAGSVSTGAIDPLRDIAAVCRRHDIWFHVDGAYGAPAAALPEADEDLKALALGDSVAVDPHKWLYAPLEAGCTLVRDRRHLIDAFSFHPQYYHFDDGGDGEAPTNFHEFSLQNSRGFRALKVWLGLQHAGRDGYVRMIRDDIALAESMYRAVEAHPELEAFTLSLSIATFRYVPADLTLTGAEREQFLNDLNTALITRLQADGELFVSNAVINGSYVMRACIVNFRTTAADVAALPEIVVRTGRAVMGELASR